MNKILGATLLLAVGGGGYYVYNNLDRYVQQQTEEAQASAQP